MNPGLCFFTFSSTTVMSMRCTNDTSDTLSRIPADLLADSNMAGITRVNLAAPMTSLPQYLCSLPSRDIDLSYQAFTTLSTATFSCLDNFRRVTLSFNQITTVNIPSGNFTTLNSLDLSSNQLTILPYSILRPSPSALNYLDLRNNSIGSVDLFLYTLKNITVLLDSNPINTSSVINPQNVTIPSSLGNTTMPGLNISLPASLKNLTLIMNDQKAFELHACNRSTILSLAIILRSVFQSVVLDCSCASYNLRMIFSNEGDSVTNTFTCSIAGNLTAFNSLTNNSCPSAAQARAPCMDPPIQVSVSRSSHSALPEISTFRAGKSASVLTDPLKCSELLISCDELRSILFRSIPLDYPWDKNRMRYI